MLRKSINYVVEEVATYIDPIFFGMLPETHQYFFRP
jgi:hypothetical protein